MLTQTGMEISTRSHPPSTQVRLNQEYIALSHSMRETVPIMKIFDELTRKKLLI